MCDELLAGVEAADGATEGAALTSTAVEAEEELETGGGGGRVEEGVDEDGRDERGWGGGVVGCSAIKSEPVAVGSAVTGRAAGSGTAAAVVGGEEGGWALLAASISANGSVAAAAEGAPASPASLAVDAVLLAAWVTVTASVAGTSFEEAGGEVAVVTLEGSGDEPVLALLSGAEGSDGAGGSLIDQQVDRSGSVAREG